MIAVDAAHYQKEKTNSHLKELYNAIRYKTCFSLEQNEKFNQTQGTGEVAMSVPYLFHHCSTGLKFLVELDNKKNYDPNYFHSLFLRDI